jgi:hypothetical protein
MACLALILIVRAEAIDVLETSKIHSGFLSYIGEWGNKIELDNADTRTLFLPLTILNRTARMK